MGLHEPGRCLFGARPLRYHYAMTIAEQIDGWVRAGYASQDEILENIAQDLRDRFRADKTEHWHEHAKHALAEHAAAAEAWPAPTHCDRITAAFRTLRAEGVVALENAGHGQSDCWDAVELARRDSDWGAVFFSWQDVLSCLAGRSLLLGFGALDRGEAHERETRRLVQRIQAVLATNNVTCTWSGNVDDRIEIAPFEWRRRRAPPEPETKSVALEGLRSWWQRLTARRARREAPQRAYRSVAALPDSVDPWSGVGSTGDPAVRHGAATLAVEVKNADCRVAEQWFEHILMAPDSAISLRAVGSFTIHTTRASTRPSPVGS